MGTVNQNVATLVRSTLHSNAAAMPSNKHLTQIEGQPEAQIQFLLDGTAFGAIEASPEKEKLNRFLPR